MTTDRPLVTLFVMAYNQERHVRAAIEGAFSQTYQPLEVVLSDDCSTDGTFTVMEQLAATYAGPHRVKLSRNARNLGLAGHVNRIVEISRGALLVGNAGDDVSEPDRVERLAAIWQQSADSVMLLHSAATQIDEGGQELGPRQPAPVIIDDPSPLTIARTGQNCIGATAAWNRELFSRFGPLPEHAAVEDGPMFFRAALLDGVRYVDAPLVRYRVGGISYPSEPQARLEFSHEIRMKARRWRLANMRCFLEDIEKIAEFPDREETRRTCSASLDALAHGLALPDRGFVRRFALLPKALVQSISRRRGYYLVNALRHVLERPYLAVRTLCDSLARRVGQAPRA